MIRINLLVILLLVTFSLNAQLRINVGGHLGGGTIKGESPSVGSFNASLFIETNTVLFAEVTPRLGYFFAKDFNALLPNSRKAYFPYMQGIYFKGITTQYFSGKIFLEEGVGLLAINDRTFNDTNLWAYGVVLSISGGWDFRGFNLDGLRFGAGADYGITFNKSLPQYSTIHLYLNYSI
jgi:hypothetical protein